MSIRQTESETVLTMASSIRITGIDSAHRGVARDGMTDPERLGVDEDEGDPRRLRSAIDPGMVRAALHEDVARLQLDRRIVHFHFNFAREDDRVVDRLGAVHGPGPSRRDIVHGKAGTVRRGRRSEHPSAHVFDVFTRRYLRRRAVGAHYEEPTDPRRNTSQITRSQSVLCL